MPRELGEIFPFGQTPVVGPGQATPGFSQSLRAPATELSRSATNPLTQTQQCKNYGAPRGCDVENARKAHIERERGKWLKPKAPAIPTGTGAGKLPQLDPTKPAVVDQTMQEASLASSITSKFVNLVAQSLGAIAQNDFQRGVGSATKKINDSQQRAVEADTRLNTSVQSYYEKNFLLGNLSSQLAPLQQTLAQQTSQLQGLTSLLNSLYPQQSSLSASVAEAQARLDYSLNRANYPLTTAGLTQQRNDSRSANFDLMSRSLALNDVNNQIYLTSDQYNSVAGQYNSTLPTAKAVSGEIDATSSSARADLENANRAEADRISAMNQTGEGVQDIKKLATDFRNYQNQVLLPLREGSFGLAGISQVLDSASRQQYYTATADAMSAGLGAVARQAPFPLAGAVTSLASAGLNTAGKSLDQTVARGGSLEDAGLRFAGEFGQATIRLNSAIQVAQYVSLADDIMRNTANPTRVYDGMSVLVDQISPAVSVVTQIFQTVAPFVPTANLASPLIVPVGNALGTSLQGTAKTLTEAVNSAHQYGGLSAPVGNYLPREVGRNLVKREEGLPPGPLTIGGAGGGATLWEAGKDFVKGLLEQKPQEASGISGTITRIAETGTSSVRWPAPIPPASVTFRADARLVELKPPVAEPVRPPGVVVGD